MVSFPEAVPRAGPEPLPALDAYLRPYASLFRHPQSRPSWESLERYVTGLLTDLPRKNCDTIAAAVAGTTTERLQHLLTDADWDALALDGVGLPRFRGQFRAKRGDGTPSSSPPSAVDKCVETSFRTQPG
jgi:hypothetical protein